MDSAEAIDSWFKGEFLILEGMTVLVTNKCHFGGVMFGGK